MDIFFQQGLSRNGLDEPYYSLIGGKRKRERIADRDEESQMQDLESRFPHQPTSEAQNNNYVLLSKERDALKEDLKKAKSKKTKASLTSRLRAYDSYIKDYSYNLERLKVDELEASLRQNQVSTIQSTPQREIELTPTPIVTSQDGNIVLPKKEVFVQETSQAAIETQVSPLLAKEEGVLPTSDILTTSTPTPTKKNNTLLFVGIGVAIVLGFMLIRKNN